jgi:hypothetical protein
MADTNEAQLLTDFLRDIAREDAHVDAAHLEARVMSAFARSTPPSFGGTRSASAHLMQPSFGAPGLMRWAIGAAVAVALLVPAMFRLNTEVPGETAHVKVDATEEVVGQASTARPARANRPATANGPAEAGQYVPQIAKSTPIGAPIAQSPITQSPITQSPITQSLDEFVPLMPMTEQELTGPFQLVRVQMPRASLGALRSPLEHPNELVEADVLLGEDGMARAIRVSTSGSVYPWRSR